MKKIYSLLLGLIISVLGFSQQTFEETDNFDIEEDTAFHCQELAVSGVGVITDEYGLQKICVDIDTYEDGQLFIYLIAPDGTTVELASGNGDDGNDYDYTCFDMTASASITTGSPSFNGSFIPEGDLSLVNNFQNANGTWQLCLMDTNGTDDSYVYIDDWKLYFDYNVPAPITRITTCSADWYDLGGDGVDYSEAEYWFWVICPDEEAKDIGLDFSLWDVEDSTNDDRMTIWNDSVVGAENNYIEIGDGMNTLDGHLVRADNQSGCLTIRWVTDGDTLVGEGWKAHISCYVACQKVQYVYDGSTPAEDTNYIAVCQGQEITFSAHGVYPESGDRYDQEDATSIFRWNFGDSTALAEGTTVSHTYADEQGYDVDLEVIDAKGCRSRLDLQRKVMVSITPTFNGTHPDDNSICLNTCTRLIPEVQTFGWDNVCIQEVTDSVRLIDVSNGYYYSDIDMHCFVPGSKITSVDQIDSVVLPMEHTWVGDLVVWIICPDGTEVELFDGNDNDISDWMGIPYSDDTDPEGPGEAWYYSFKPGASVLFKNATVTNVTLGNGDKSGDSVDEGTYRITDDSKWADLIGCPLNGTWTIKVLDDQGADDGWLFPWDVSFADSLYADEWGYDMTGFADSTWTGSDVDNGSNSDIAKACVTVVGDNDYKYTVTDKFGCSYDTTITITGTGVDYDLTRVNIKCKDGSEGEAHVSVTDGTATHYYWKLPNGTTGDDASTTDWTNLTAGTFHVTVENSDGCKNIKTIEITEPATYVSATETHEDPKCKDGSDGSIDLTPAGGTPGSSPAYTFDWESGESTEDLADLSKGTYKVTIKDGNDCPFSLTITLDEPTAVTVTHDEVDVDCNGAGNGSIDLTPSGGTPGTPAYTFNWSDGSTTEDLLNLSGGTYSVTVKDGNDCPFTISNIAIDEPTAISVVEDNTTHSDCGAKGGTADLTVTNGSPSYTYTWTNISTGNTLPSGDVSDEDLTDVAAGNYRLVVEDDHHCLDSLDVSITDNNAPTSSLKDTVHNKCYGDHNGSVTVSVSGGDGNYSYQWDNDGTGDSDDTETITGLLAGTYSVTVTDGVNCKTTETFTVNEPALLVANFLSTDSVECHGESNGAASISVSGGTPTYSYQWKDDSGSAVGTDSPNITGLSVGTYSVTVTDDSTCTQTVTNIKVLEPTELVSVFVKVDSVKCNGEATGSIDIDVSGGVVNYTYDWDGDGFDDSQDLTNLGIGTYTVTVKDHNGCTKSLTTEIKEPSALVITSSVDSIRCNGELTDINVQVSGGVVNYTYDWDGDGFDDDDTLLSVGGGSYRFIVKDHNACKDTLDVTIGEPTPFDNSSATVKANCGANDGKITITASGSNAGGYTYEWFAPNGVRFDSSATAVNDTLISGTYTVVVIDSKSCSDTLYPVITEDGAGTVAAQQANKVSCYGYNDGVSVATMTGGMAEYTYYWILDGDTLSSAPVIDAKYTQGSLKPGTYAVIVIDKNNCRSEDAVTITEPDSLESVAISENLKCYQDQEGLVEITNIKGGTEPYKLEWTDASNNIVGSSEAITGLSAGTYTYLVKDANDCPSSDVLTISEPSLLVLSTTLEGKESGGDLYATTVGGTPPYTYLWSNGSTDSVLINQTAGEYSVVVTDANGCQQRDVLFIDVPLVIPTIISTNGDGKNDTWRIKGIEAYTEIHIEIYNRWGNIVFEYTGSGADYGDAVNQFQGISTNGQELPLGSYVYILDLIKEDRDYSGIVTIIKEKQEK